MMLTKLLYGGKVMLTGLLIVFLGLIILICFINLLSWLLGRKQAKKQPQPTPQPAKPAPQPVQIPEPIAEAAAQETGASPDELVAVITAALMAYAGTGKKMVVKDIRPARSSAWARAGRIEQLNGRL